MTLESPQANYRAEAYDRNRRELVAYATRLVVRHHVAEELVQEAALRLLRDSRVPDDEMQVRAWLFKVVSHLAIDHLRRHSTWREVILVETRDRASRDLSFVAESRSLRGSPELKAIAREHLVVCFSCVLRNLPAEQAAALLLKEVYGFTLAETADLLEVGLIQVKNWLQVARRTLDARYARTCALVNKEGACHQCVELNGFFNGSQGDPLAGSAGDLDARLDILRRERETHLGPWHRRMLSLVDDVLSGE